MKFNLRHATSVFAISVGLFCAPGFASGCQQQGDHDRGQDRGYQQGDRHDNGRNDRDRDRRNGAPYGGYLQTCHDVRTSGNTLQANCKKRNGKWRQSSLRNFNGCTGQIENDNGRLVCGR
jgi:CVNH domain